MFLTVNQTALLAKNIIEESSSSIVATTVAPIFLQQTSDVVRANFDWPEQISEKSKFLNEQMMENF